jgi:hypothetical protein
MKKQNNLKKQKAFSLQKKFLGMNDDTLIKLWPLWLLHACFEQKRKKRIRLFER